MATKMSKKNRPKIKTDQTEKTRLSPNRPKRKKMIKKNMLTIARILISSFFIIFYSQSRVFVLLDAGYY